MGLNWLGFAGGLLDSAIGLFGSSHAQSSAQQANKEMQERAIQWEKEQYLSRHQWEVSDLRKAGLNPILSALNGGSSAASVGVPSSAPVKPEVSISKSLEAISHSALMKKQQESVDFQNQTERIKADADMLRARLEEARNPSAIGLNESQATMYNMSADQIKQLTPLKVAYEKANIKKTEQDMLNSIIEVRAKVQYYKDLGQSALMQGSAAQMHAQAAMNSAFAQQVIAQTAAENGVSERKLKAALTGKADAETYEAMQRASKIMTEDKKLNWQLQKDMIHNPVAGRYDNDLGILPNILFGTGEFIKSGLGY